MKKKLLILITIISIFAFTKVSAAGQFYFDWETPPNETIEPYEHASYKDGYITTDYDYTNDATAITIYDINGQVKKQKNVSYGIYNLQTEGDNIYFISYNSGDSKLVLMNENFDIVEEIPGSFDEFRINENNITAFAWEQVGTNWKTYTYTIKKDLSSFTKREYENKDWTYGVDFTALWDYLDEHFYANNNNSYSGSYYGEDYKGNLAVIAQNFVDTELCAKVNGTIYSPDHDIETAKPGTIKPRLTQAEEVDCYHPYIGLYKANGSTIWEKDLDEYLAVSEAKFIDDYILAIGLKETSSDVIIFDMEGNVKQVFSSDSGFNRINKTDEGFAVNQGYCYNWTNYVPKSEIGGVVDSDFITSPKPALTANILKTGSISPSPYTYIGCSCAGPIDDYPGRSPKPTLQSNNIIELAAAPMCTFNHQFYYQYHAIEPIVVGEGNIEVASKGKPGEPVTFVVTPAKGYTLGVIKVTTSDGQVLTFTDYTFTMPSADVTIEVEFLSEGLNPKTADIALIGVSIAALISLGLFFHQRKRLKELK